MKLTNIFALTLLVLILVIFGYEKIGKSLIYSATDTAKEIQKDREYK